MARNQTCMLVNAQYNLARALEAKGNLAPARTYDERLQHLSSALGNETSEVYLAQTLEHIFIRRNEPARPLRSVASLCQQLMRDDDKLGRTGGEEFLAVLPGERVQLASG